MRLITNTSTFSTAEDYVTNAARSNRIRLTAEQKTRAINAVTHMMGETGTHKPGDYVLLKILQTAVSQ